MYQKGDVWVVHDGDNIYGIYDDWDKIKNLTDWHIITKIPINTKGKWSIP